MGPSTGLKAEWGSLNGHSLCWQIPLSCANKFLHCWFKTVLVQWSQALSSQIILYERRYLTKCCWRKLGFFFMKHPVCSIRKFEILIPNINPNLQILKYFYQIIISLILFKFLPAYFLNFVLSVFTQLNFIFE